MASPPAKRQRRSKAVFSDDEEEPPGTARQESTSRRTANSIAANAEKVAAVQKSTKSIGLKTKSKPNTDTSKATPKKAALKPKPASPNKPKKSPRRQKTEENSKSLHSFFGRASEEQRWSRKADTPTEEVDDVENGDAIEDDDEPLDEAFSPLVEGQEDVKFQLDRRKDRATLTKNGSQTTRTSLPASTHNKFFKPPAPSIKKNGIKAELGDSSDKNLHRPWADRYGPANLEELAVHKKKVADVQKWLDEVLNGRDPRVCAMQNIVPSCLNSDWIIEDTRAERSCGKRQNHLCCSTFYYAEFPNLALVKPDCLGHKYDGLCCVAVR
jgi:cell cycle checkpoint protein